MFHKFWLPRNSAYGEFGFSKYGKILMFQFCYLFRKGYILKYDNVIYGFMHSKKGIGLKIPFLFWKTYITHKFPFSGSLLHNMHRTVSSEDNSQTFNIGY